MNRLRSWSAVVASTVVALVASVVGCGGDGTDDASAANEVLFSGPPGELLPHETGRTSRFRVRARSGEDSISSIVTTRILSEGPDGEFLVESVSDGGIPRRWRARETANEIRVEAVGAPRVDGFEWRVIEPPAVLVRTPVVAGESVETRFARTLDVLLSVDGRREARAVTFEGASVRIARGRESLVLDGRSVETIAFDVRGESDTARGIGPSGPAVGTPIDLAVQGTEYVVPGVGVVREVLGLVVRSSDAESRIEIETEREWSGGWPRGLTPPR